MITGLDIICISSIEWDFLWQGHQEINLRLAKAGNRVLYIENTGVRSPAVRDAWRIKTRLKNWVRSWPSHGFREVAPNFYVCSTPVLPPFGPLWQRHVNRRLILPGIRRIARRLGMEDTLLWTYLPTNTAVDLINLLRTPRSLTIYYCIADFAQLTPHVQSLRQSEETLVRLSDVVFAQEPSLAAHCARWNDNVHIFPFGVNLNAFPLEDNHGSNAALDETTQRRAAFLQAFPKPVIGYIGGLHGHVDFGMLLAMARARPNWSWLFVGAVQTAVGDLAELPNVYLVGQQEHRDLVRYIRLFDVCIVPYVNSHFTSTVVPTKINEYLAVGKPVVSSRLPAVCEFNNEHNILQTASTEPADFLNAIEVALTLPNDEATIARRRAVAELGNWDSRLEAMSQVIETELRARDSRAKKQR